MQSLRAALRSDPIVGGAIRALARHAAYNSDREKEGDLALLMAVSIVLVEEERGLR